MAMTDSSPPQGNLTLKQRELKRQRELSRRDSKVNHRWDRSTSNPYLLSPSPSPPEMMSRTLSEYSNHSLQTPINPRVFENISYPSPQILHAQQQQSATSSSYSMGVPHNPNQQLQGPGMPQQMHMGVSGPRPQVNQHNTIIGKIKQEVGEPSAHALQHLNPGYAEQAQLQLMQQQQQRCTYAWSWCFRAFYIGLPSI